VSLAAAALAGCGSPARATSAPIPPLSAVSTADGATWAALPMGILSQRVNTFWELFGRTTGRWVLATPPGIATNGGVLAAPGPSTSVLSGVVPSFALGFSAIAALPTPGSTWSTGVLPAGLVAAPDALAVATSGQRFALLSKGPAALVTSHVGLSTWTTVATDRSISTATGTLGCALAAPSAVAVAHDGSILLGGRCVHGGGLPIAVFERGAWQVAGGATGEGADDVVLRLGTTPTGAVALLVSGAPQHRGLVIASSVDGVTRWTEGAELALPEGSSILSTSLDASGEVTAVLESSTGVRTADSIGIGALGWTTLPGLPAGTVDVVPGQPAQALAVDHSELVVYDAQRGAWDVAQRIQVPIEYGSSG
jgi:hypothetical protein